MMKLTYPVVMERFEEEDGGGYTVTAPDLPGRVTFGRDLGDALQMAQDAASGWVLTELEDGNPAPPASALEQVRAEHPGDLVTLVLLDMDAYAAKYGKKAVRKNVTVSAWLDTFAEKAGINYSAVLRDSLEQRYRDTVGA